MSDNLLKGINQYCEEQRCGAKSSNRVIYEERGRKHLAFTHGDLPVDVNLSMKSHDSQVFEILKALDEIHNRIERPREPTAGYHTAREA